MKQYRITSDNIPQDSPDDAHLAPDDPIHELKIVQYLAGLNSEGRLHEYRNHVKNINQGSNITVTANEKVRLMKENDIQPGTPEWFRLWFARQLMTGEPPVKNNK